MTDKRTRDKRTRDKCDDGQAHDGQAHDGQAQEGPVRDEERASAGRPGGSARWAMMAREGMVGIGITGPSREQA